MTERIRHNYIAFPNTYIMKFPLAIFVALSILLPNINHAQSVQIDARFGIDLQFAEGFEKLSEDLYSPMMQRQLFSTENEELTVFIARFPGLDKKGKQQWASGIPGHPLSFAEEVTDLGEEKWPFERPVFSDSEIGLFEHSTSGMSVFLTRHSYADSIEVISYVLFIARDNTFDQMIAGIKTKKGQSDITALDKLLSTIVIAPSVPAVDEDFYTQAERAYVLERDPVKAGKLYALVPPDHPMYAEAQRHLGYRIKGSEFGDWDGAVSHVEAAYHLQSDDVNTIENLGRVYLKTDKYAEGVALMARAEEDERILEPGSTAPAMLLGTFEDDYGVPYTIRKSIVYQHTANTYHIKFWNLEEQYLIAQNDADNASGEQRWTRIDWIELTDMAPYTWAYCLSAYDAKTAQAAEEVTIANGNEPRTGCNGFPYSRMKPVL